MTTTNDPRERSKQRALEGLARARSASDKARRDIREFSEGLLAIGTRVLEDGEYPPKKFFSDAVTTSLHGLAIWASWWMPTAPEASAPPQAPAEKPNAADRPKK